MPEQTGYTYPAVTGERFGFVLLAGIPKEGLGEAFLSFGDILDNYSTFAISGSLGSHEPRTSGLGDGK